MGDQEKLLAYWSDQLKDFPEARLPSDYPRSTSVSQQRMEEEASLAFSEETCMSLLRFSLIANVKPFTIALAAFACLLRKYTYEEDIVIGSSSRSFNPLIFRLDVGGSVDAAGEKRQKTLQEIVLQTADAEKKAEENEVDFNLLVDHLRRSRGLGDDALFSLFQVW